jgi:plastocyanin
VTDGEQIEVTEHKYPAEIRVGVGETITFNNNDDLNHTVEFRGDPDCGIMLIGESISVRLEGPGEYSYFCRFHSPTMAGKIIVE